MGKQSNANKATQLRQFRAEQKQRELEAKRRQTKIICLISAIALIVCVATVLLIVFLNQPEETPDSNNQSSGSSSAQPNDAIPMSEMDFSEINLKAFSETDEVTNYVKLNVSYTDEDGVKQNGDIVIRLFDKVAPKTVENFQNLVKSGFYTGTSFHRVMKGFMIQGGSGDGEAELTPIEGEFTNNGFYNNLEHLRGVVSMARTNDPNSATSQFFIMHESNIDLDANYASFGYVVYGMDTVDGIANIEVKMNDNGELASPVKDVTINSAVFMTSDAN